MITIYSFTGVCIKFGPRVDAQPCTCMMHSCTCLVMVSREPPGSPFERQSATTAQPSNPTSPRAAATAAVSESDRCAQHGTRGGPVPSVRCSQRTGSTHDQRIIQRRRGRRAASLSATAPVAASLRRLCRPATPTPPVHCDRCWPRPLFGTHSHSHWLALTLALTAIRPPPLRLRPTRSTSATLGPPLLHSAHRRPVTRLSARRPLDDHFKLNAAGQRCRPRPLRSLSQLPPPIGPPWLDDHGN